VNDNDIRKYDRQREKKRRELEQRYERQSRTGEKTMADIFWEGLNFEDE